ncbi:MAG: cation transporter [Candidatus Omnitrophica bacterium]|nr:cation transporter [Candidatus Omnitrophota bacterium]
MHNHENIYRLGEKSVILVICVNLVLFIVKFLAGVYGKSQALVADSFHTASDVISSIAVLIGLKYASTPADNHHPYGHGKAESIAAKIVSLVLIAIGFKIAYNSSSTLVLRDFNRPHQITLWIVLLSIAVKEFQFHYALRWGRRIKSTSIVADAWHHRSDALSSIAAFIGILGARLGFEMLDPIAGIVVGLFIVKIGFDIFHTAFDELLDSALPVDVTDKIKELTLSTEGVKKMTVLKGRKHGLNILVDMTIEVDKDMTVKDAHTITAKVRRSVLKDVANAGDVLIHVEPYEE